MKKEKEEDCNDISKTFGGCLEYALKICVLLLKNMCRNTCK